MTWKLYARETLMCGLRQIPIAGHAADIVEKVGERRARLDLAEDVAAIREELTGFQSGMRDLVEKTIREAMGVFARPQIEPATLSQLIDEVRQLNEVGYHSAVFDGLFLRSVHYEELKRRPEHYGRLLDDSESFPEGQFPVFVDLDKTRLLAIPPAMLWTLLSNTHDVDSHVESPGDVWALPGEDAVETASPSFETTALRSPRVPMDFLQSKKPWEPAQDEVEDSPARPHAEEQGSPIPTPHPEERAQPASRRTQPPPDDPFREERERIARLVWEAEQAERDAEERAKLIEREAEERAKQAEREAEERAKQAEAERRRREAEEKERQRLEQERQRLAEQEAEAQRRLRSARNRALFATPLTVFRDPLKSGGEGPEMVVIPAGSFLMGSPKDESGRDDNEGPQTQITLQPFALGKYAVTFEEYDLFCARTKAKKPGDQGWGRGRSPVINVNVEDAEAYCAWLSAETGAAYRLPSEAEWEHACRAGSRTPFEPTVAHSHEGQTITPDEVNYNGNYIYSGSSKGAYRRQTVPVDFEKFRANAWGLWQMHGNVWEWTADCWNGSYSGRPTDGSAWRAGDCTLNAIRGGSWNDTPRYLRSARRDRFRREVRYDDLGFRVARTLP